MKSFRNNTIAYKLSSIILLILFIACNSNNKPNNDTTTLSDPLEKKDTLHGNRKGGSSPSNYPDLQQKLARYLSDSNNNFLLTQFKDSTGTLQTTKLQGFVFTAKQLKTLIDYKHGKNNVTRVVFYLGVDTTGFISNGKKYGNIKLSAIGMDSSGNLIFIPGGASPNAAPNDTVLDQADPCPPNGPFDPPATAFTIPTIKNKPKN